MYVSENYTVTYCMNVFPAYDVQNLLILLNEKIPQIVERTQPDQITIPLGLWFPIDLLEKSSQADRDRIGRVMARNNQYICTLNAFPQGQFHEKRIKENVYFPDWTDDKRFEYTCRVIEFASNLSLTQGIIPVSTVPISYGNKYSDSVWINLKKMCVFLHKIKEQKGLHFRLLLEPEPGCVLDRISNSKDFLQELSLRIPNAREYIGICLDTCHCAVMFEKPIDFFDMVENQGYSIDKIQISAALKLQKGINRSTLRKFNEVTYLHQTTILEENGDFHFFNDLKPALKSSIQGETRTHFHIPLYTEPLPPLESTRDLLDKDFFRKVATNGRILEIETYTFSILPDKQTDVISSISDEIKWLNQCLKNAL